MQKKKIVTKLNQIEKINTNSSHNLLIFINYSGTNDILNSISKISKNKNKITKKNFEKNLKTYGYSDPDLIIRTGGFQRLSDFMLYQTSFSELSFSKKLWPDFNSKDLNRIIKNYHKIVRKFGK